MPNTKKNHKYQDPEESITLDSLTELTLVPKPIDEAGSTGEFKMVLKNMFHERDTHLKAVRTDIRKLNREVNGDPNDDDKKGLKRKVAVLEESVGKMEKEREKFKTAITVVIAIATTAATVIPILVKLVWGLLGK